MLSSSSRGTPASSAPATSSRVAHSTSTGTPSRAPSTASRAATATPPASVAWFSLTRIASSRPPRWLTPPPMRTASFSSARSPGVVLRVSRMLHAGALDGPDVARRQGRDARQPAEEVQRHPLGSEDRARGARQLGHEAAVGPDALVGVGVPAQVGVDALEHLLGHPQPGRHPLRLLVDARTGARSGLDHDLGRQVSVPHVLREGDVDHFQHQAEAGSRSREIPAAA